MRERTTVARMHKRASERASERDHQIYLTNKQINAPRMRRVAIQLAPKCRALAGIWIECALCVAVAAAAAAVVVHAAGISIVARARTRLV